MPRPLGDHIGAKKLPGNLCVLIDMSEDISYIKQSIKDYPFDSWFTDTIPLIHLDSDERHLHVWRVNAVCGVLLNGALLSVFEEGWGNVPIKSLPDSLMAIKMLRAAELLEEAINLFPDNVLEQIDQRRKWAWGKAVGSESIPSEIERLSPLLTWEALKMPASASVYILENIEYFPSHAKWLDYYIKSKVSV